MESDSLLSSVAARIPGLAIGDAGVGDDWALLGDNLLYEYREHGLKQSGSAALPLVAALSAPSPVRPRVSNTKGML